MKIVIGPVEALFLIVVASALFVGGLWLTLKAWDALRAWKYNRKAARRQEVAQAFADGCAFVMGEYARLQPQTYRVVRATPDRPKPDPWMKMVRDDIEEIFEELEGMT